MSFRLTAALAAAAFLAGCPTDPDGADTVIIFADVAPLPDAGTEPTPEEKCKPLRYDPVHAQCVQCLEHDDCSVPGAETDRAFCHPKRLLCVKCYLDEQCGPFDVCDPERNFCVECLADADCKSGVCDEGKNVCLGCGADGECDDKNPCTSDSCQQKVCIHAPVPDGAACADEPNACTTDTCLDGVCRHLAVPDGSACANGPACAVGTSCLAGVCQGGSFDPQCACTTSAECDPGEYCENKGCVPHAGKCLPMPVSCPADAAPVCGCDDVTYLGACKAHQAGAAVASGGACCFPPACAGPAAIDVDGDGCPETCPCQTNSQCAESEICLKNKGDCGGAGHCVAKPAVCGPGDGPVCDCDGYTWDEGECAANQAGASVAAAGACPPDLCNGPGLCDPGYFCELPPGSCGNGAQGTCLKVPATCATDGVPVCDCDGKQYPNSCLRQKAGVAAGPCSCTDNAQCTTAELCLLTACAGAGVCVARPTGCPDFGVPVCTCDGETWASECDAHAAGKNVASAGACCIAPVCPLGAVDTDGDGCADTCICAGAATCPEGLACVAPKCGAEGLCVVAPTSCDLAKKGPVCGCDGRTYASACTADQASAGAAFAGACPCGTAADCKSGQYCARESCAVTGTCQPKPESCTDVVKAVCGCDGATYTSECAVTLAGIGVAYLGACCSPPKCAGGLVIDTNGDGCADACACKGTSDCGAGGICKQSTCGSEGVCVACEAVPGAVCACDGATYASACSAAKALVTIGGGAKCCKPLGCELGGTPTDTNSDGCPDACACTTESDCGAKAFCAATACGKAGACASCAEVSGPVCGCDGASYPNACEAEAAGVGIAGKGCCKAPVCELGGAPKDTDGDTCADTCTCTSSKECSAKAVCSSTSCGSAGTCVACDSLPAATCGCNGVEYSSACEAKAGGWMVSTGAKCCKPLLCAAGEGVDTDKDGCADTCGTPCASPCDCYANADVALQNACWLKCATCGSFWSCKKGLCIEECGPIPESSQKCTGPAECIESSQCEAGAYCAKVDGQCGGIGKCLPAAQACPNVYAPACGCDGKTYDNACIAAMFGVNISHAGLCSLKCSSVATCSTTGLACDPKVGQCSDSFSEGTCVEVPKTCPDTIASVCGCDGVSYKNDCMRLKAGAAKAYDDQCGCKAISCSIGNKPIDSDSDGCDDACIPCGIIICASGSYPKDTNGDGCGDICQAQSCNSSWGCSSSTYCNRDGACGGEGLCMPRPTWCEPYDAPVCGCDGETYSNPCEAAAKWVSVAAKGACVVECSPSFDTCGEGLCEQPAGLCAATGAGVCVTPEALCDPNVDVPVCGCDGAHYASDCERRKAGVQKAHDGACDCVVDVECGPGMAPIDLDGDSCPETCQPSACAGDADCGDSSLMYCARPSGDCGGAGTCAERPVLCAKDYAPVCGCDGKTWDNACIASTAGVNVSGVGECVKACSPSTGCGDGATWCELPDGLCASGADAFGACVDKPVACAVVDAPECGCDGKTYTSGCARRTAGVSKLADGPCACATTSECALGQYCQFDAACGQTGKCISKPSSCAGEAKSVCGCDGVSYSNVCAAAKAGSSVAATGKCPDANQYCKSNEQCLVGVSYCYRAPGNCAAAGGVCIPRPAACAADGETVCGCNGKTYANACLAGKDGVQVSAVGACP